MTALDVIGAALRLQHAATAEQADAILADLDSEYLRTRLREEWDAAHWRQVQRLGSPKCLCSHSEDHHITDRRGRVVCRSAACGCAEFRTGGTSK